MMEIKNILVADDNESMRKMMYEIITREFDNISVVIASNGEEVIDKVKKEKYDLKSKKRKRKLPGT